MTKYRIVKTVASKVHAAWIIKGWKIDPNEDRFLVQKRSLFIFWNTVATEDSLEDAENYVNSLILKLNKDEIVGEY